MKTTFSLDDFPGANPLVRDYAADFSRVRSWFHYDPQGDGSVAERLAELDSKPAADRSAAREAVVRQLSRWGVGQEALQGAELLGQPGTYTVATGQQAGLFGGPLYTVLKAISVVKLARELNSLFTGHQFVPTFWIASGDSDFDEVRSTRFISQEGSLAELSLEPGGQADEALIIGAREVGSGIAAQLEALGEPLPGGEFRNETLEGIREAYTGGNLVDGFARWMSRLFSGTELVLIDPQDPALMACASGLIQGELNNSEVSHKALATRNAAISTAGYALQVEQLEGDTNLFLLDESGMREKISRAGDGYLLRPSGRKFTGEELSDLAAGSPASFVCGVMLRPVYQNVLFPPAAFVGGAAELAYRAQTTAVFDLHGEKMAPAFLRASATVLRAKQSGLLDELGWELPDCFTVPQDLAARAVEGFCPDKMEDAMQRYREILQGADRELQQFAEQLNPNLGQSFDTLRENLTRHADKLEKKINGALKQKHTALVGQVERLHTAVYPGLAVQERQLNILSFLPRYGLGLIPRLIDILKFPAWEHQAVILD